MIRTHILATLLALSSLLAVGAQGENKKFYNLTADEVRIDSVLPFFTCRMPLEGAWQDSTYTVEIAYPEFYGMSQADIERYNRIDGSPLPALPEVEADVVVDRKRGSLAVSFVPLAVRDGRHVKLVSFMLDVKSTPKPAAMRVSRQTEADTPASRYASHSVLATGTWAKIRVPETGIYELNNTLIRRAGFSDLSRVKIYGYGGALQDEVLSGEYLAAHDDLAEVPTCMVDGRRLFHAVGTVTWEADNSTRRTRNPYSDYGYYFITESDGEPLTVDSTAFVDSFYPSPDYYHTLHEVDNYAWYQGGRNLFEDDPIMAGSSKDYALNTGTGQASAGRVSIGVTAGQACTVRIAVNDSVVGTYSMTSFSEYDHGKEIEYTYRISHLPEADTITVTNVAGGPVRLDYISIYHETPRPRPTLAGVSFPSPEYVYNITNQDLHASGPLDMVIIVPTSAKLTGQATRIKELHEQRDGMRVAVVPADELYNEFSSGTPDANAYRRFLKMLYDRAETEADMPSYLLLFGDCVWDNRMNTDDCSGLNPDDFLLCHESEDSFSDVYCYVDDGFFCSLDDGEGGDPLRTDMHDVAVGRFPVRSEEEAKIMVDKLLAYIDNENAGSWQNLIVFMGDDGNDNRHMEDANDIAALAESLNPAMQVERVMWDAYTRENSSTGHTYPAVSRLIKQRQQAGALVMNYSGHGRPDQVSHERVLTINDFAGFTNTNLPLWITASCNIMPFDSQQDNIGETAVLNRDGGAVAFFGTTRTVYVDRNKAINLAYMDALLTPDETTGKLISIGEAQRRAKNALITPNGQGIIADGTQNKLQYSLLGDPALVLNIPDHRAVIDSINGVSVASGDNLPRLSAGTVVTVKGHIETAEGGLDTNFGGVVTAVVKDAEKLVVCRLNDTSADGAETAFEYYDRSTVLFNGSDSVRAGEFTLTFAVTKDIEYSDMTGLINLFAVNTDTRATVNGYSESFTVGGSGSLATDSIGPSIYCYLNSPSFTNGGNVNPTPYFVAEIYDKDGLNTTGGGIGHDLTLTIDGEMSRTYVLNDSFEYDFGSYTNGRTYYNIPELSVGEHVLRFRAWDIMNNSSTAELRFNVVNGLSPNLLGIGCTDNPARTSTTFIINHDRSGSDIEVEIEVFDISGRPLWHHTESGVSAGGAYTVTWNLTGDDGSRLQTGVYVYRVKISSDGSSKVSKAQKLIIVGS